MSTPLPVFAPGTRVIAQNAAGQTGPGTIYAKGAGAGQANISFLRNDTGAPVVLANANFVAEDAPFVGGQDQFKLNFKATP